MKSTDSRRPSSGKTHGKNPLPASHSKASGSPKASKASSAVQSSGAASKPGVGANGTKKPHQLASLPKASSSAKSSKGRSSVQGSDVASKADPKEDGTGKRPLVAEPSTARRPSGGAVKKGGATATDVKADRADKTLTSRDPSKSGRPKEPKDDGSKAVPEDDDDSRFESAQSTLSLAAHIETKDKRKKQAPPSQESVTKEKDKGGAKEKQTTSPATSLPAPEANNQEKTPAAVNGEADAKAPKTMEKKHSITYNMITAKSHEGKKQRKKRGHSRGNKAVQTNPEEAQTAPAGPPIHLLFSPSSCSLCDSNAPPSYYGAMQTFQIGKYGAVTPAQQRSRGVVKKTTTTTTTTRRVQESDRTPRSRQLVEETTTEEVQEAADDRSDAGGSKDSTSVAGNVTSGGAVKNTVTTTRRLKNRDKHGRNSSDDKDPRPQDDVIETVIREVVEVESESAPVIVGLARDASATQYRYVESRRPASSPYRARHGVDAVYQRMQLRPPGFWAHQPYWRALAPYARPCRHGAVQHIPGCRLAAFSRRALSCWGPRHLCGGHHGGPLCQRPPTPAPLASANTGWGASPSLPDGGARGRSLGYSSDASEGTYDVIYDAVPDLAAASAGVRRDDRRRPDEFIWETPPREEFVYYSCANVVAGPAPPAADGERGPTDDDVDSDGHNRDRVDARAARAATDLSMAAGRQVGRIPADCVRSPWSRQRFCSREQHDARLPPVPRGDASLPGAGAAGERGGRPVLGALGADAAVAAIPCPTPQVSGQGRAVAAFAAPTPSFGRVVGRRRAGRRGSRVRHTGADGRPRPRLRGVQGYASRRSHLATQLSVRFPRQRFSRPAVFPVLRARQLRAQRPHSPCTRVRRLASTAG
ncbi:uncharacterized protein [Dermacentor albipictus]|uniref:uncharacterized protein isoform X3 n=1 Tax=Dermacentor albipictus TaxID=60249 RepID=UPI0031FDBF7E